MVTHFAIEIGHAGERTPWTPEISFGRTVSVRWHSRWIDPWLRITRQPAVHEHKTKRFFLGCVRGSDMSAVATVNFATIEYRRGRSVNEIHPSRDVAVGEILAAVVDHQRVLPTDHATVIELRAI